MEDRGAFSKNGRERTQTSYPMTDNMIISETGMLQQPSAASVSWPRFDSQLQRIDITQSTDVPFLLYILLYLKIFTAQYRSETSHSPIDCLLNSCRAPPPQARRPVAVAAAGVAATSPILGRNESRSPQTLWRTLSERTIRTSQQLSRRERIPKRRDRIRRRRDRGPKGSLIQVSSHTFAMLR